MTSEKIRRFLERNPHQRKRYFYTDYHLDSTTLAVVFWELCDHQSLPPTQEAYISDYLCRGIKEATLKKIPMKWLIKRASVAWKSFMMELDFYCQIRDCGFFQGVEKDILLDRKAGYDLVIRWNDQAHYVHLFWDNPSAQYFIQLKRKRKHKIRTQKGLPPPIDFPLNPLYADRIGNIYLYKEKDLIKLRQRLIQHTD